MLSILSRGTKRHTIIRAVALIVIIAVLDWRVADEVPLGFLYLLPMLLLGRVLRPWQTLIVAGLCTFLAEFFDTFAWKVRTGIPRDVLYFMAFFTIGIFVYEVTRNRQVILEQMDEITRQSEARREADEQLKALVESSPAAILTASTDGSILIANEAAHRMLIVQQELLAGRPIQMYFPSLATVLRRDAGEYRLRTVMQSRGRREDGEAFIADICFSTYRTGSGPRLAAMVLDTSDELRSREESSLQQMLTGSRIAVGAVSHEVRNICGAIAVVHENLLHDPHLKDNKDFEALGSLVIALEQICSLDLGSHPEKAAEVDLHGLLDDLRIVISPSLLESEIACEWLVPAVLAPAWADRTNLMQIMLNLITNSIRALNTKRSDRWLSIRATADGPRIAVSVTDNGPGVAHPEELFRPFQAGAHSTGLGLYLSRSFARSFGGDLKYVPQPTGAHFLVELPSTATTETLP